MKRKILISHAFGPDNRGDHELLLKLLDILYTKFGENSEISIFSSFPEKSKSVFTNKNIDFFKSPISLAGMEKNFINYLKLIKTIFVFSVYFFTEKRILMTKEQNKIADTIRKADLIFYCPGGYLYSNGRSFYANIFNGFLLSKCSPKTKIYFSPMSIGPFYSKFDQWLTKHLLKTSHKIFARESYSFKLVKQLGFSNVYLTTDLAWYKSNEEIFFEDLIWENKFVITVLDWDYNNLGDQANYKRRFFEEILKCCEVLNFYSGEKVVLYNQVGSGNGDTNDEKLIQKILNTIPRYVEYSGEEITPDSLKSRLHFSRGLVASRFHSALFAIQAEVPFVALSYQPKAEFILKDLNLSEFSREIHNFDGKEVGEFLMYLSSNRTTFKEKICNAKLESISLINDEFYMRID